MVAQWSGTDPKWSDLRVRPTIHQLPDEAPGDSLALRRGLVIALPLALGLWGIIILLVHMLLGG